MKKTSRPATVAILACLCLFSSLAFAQESPREAFGKGNPFKVEELPAGKLKTHLQSLNPQAREKAMNWLHTLDFSQFDAAEHLRVDQGGGIYIVCPDDHGNCEGHSHGPAAPEAANDSPAATGTIAPQAAQTTEPPTANISVSVSSPPAYNSRPGATRHIYLDFNGGIVSGTAWSTTTYDVKVWSQDTDRTTFNDAEQTWMRRVYERLAEDYAPFAVNVTTDTAYDPDNYTGNKDYVGWLMICETTDNNGVALPHNGSGGVAYVGVFGNSTYSPTYQPAWVTSTNGGGNEAIIAEAASHEMGHNMGLTHDGTSTASYYGGHVATASAPSWGPIMGTGYNQNVSQWSKGEYYDSRLTGSNPQSSVDDLAVMSARIPYRADDHGDNFTGATAVVATNNAISQTGIVETTDDPDVFSFTTGPGAISLTANPYRCDADTWGGNLDIILELYDSSQTLISSSNPAAETNASISTTIAAAGTYYLVLKPSAAGSPLVSPPSGYTVYGSLGQYTINGTVQPFDPPLGLTGISPSSGNPGSTVTVDISGTKLASNTVVGLKKVGHGDIAGTSVQMIGNTLRCQFNLTGAAAGAWDVVATNPDLATSTLPAAFTVIAVPTTLWSENFDGTVTGWTSQATLGTHSWVVSTAQSHTTDSSYFASAPAVKITSRLTSPAISIPADATSLQLKFWHSYGLDSQKDGGRLELSVDNGTSWFAIENANSGASFAQNGYTATIGTANPNIRSEFNNLSAWTGTSSGFVQTVVNLTSANFANKTFRARWIIATDASNASTGWYVDSVSLTGTSGGPPPNESPVITVAASTSSAETQTEGPTTYQIIHGVGANLSVTATDDAGESDLTYTWQSAGPAPVIFSVNGNNAAKNSTATFSAPGDYLLTATARDAGDLAAPSSVNVRVISTDSLVITPASGSLTVGTTLQFSAAARDQFDTLAASQPSPINWSTSGGGSIDSNGLFTATTVGGPFTITATSGVSYSATAQVTVTNVLPLTWDANGITANLTDGEGAWIGIGTLWWDGVSNVNWAPGSDATFGNAGTGGAVTLASPTSVNNITFNAFSGTYTLGTAGQTLTINGGIDKTSASGIISIVSPVNIGGPQTWTNNSAGSLTASGALDTLGSLLTVDGTGPSSLAGVISGTGGIVKNGTGDLILSNSNTYSGTTTITAGKLALGANNVLPDSTAVSIGNATLDATTFADTVGTLGITSTATINLGTGAALAFADSSSIDWTGGTLNITGTFVSGVSLRFGTSNTGLTSTQLAKFSGAGLGPFFLNSVGYITFDSTPPTLSASAIVDDKSGGPVTVNTLVTYTVTFSEDIDSSTVTAADFGNAGTSAVTIGPVTETTTPGEFSVQATPTTVGILQLRINQSAELKDLAGNALDTDSAIADDTSIAVSSVFDAWADGAFSNGALGNKDAAFDFDGGGLATGIEWVVGGDPTTATDDATNAPTGDATTDPACLTFTYRRSDAANTDANTDIKVQYCAELSDWTNAVAGPDIVINEDDNFYGNSPGIDKVEVKIKLTPALGNRLFARLKVVVAP